MIIVIYFQNFDFSSFQNNSIYQFGKILQGMASLKSSEIKNRYRYNKANYQIKYTSLYNRSTQISSSINVKNITLKQDTKSPQKFIIRQVVESKQSKQLNKQNLRSCQISKHKKYRQNNNKAKKTYQNFSLLKSTNLQQKQDKLIHSWLSLNIQKKQIRQSLSIFSLLELQTVISLVDHRIKVISGKKQENQRGIVTYSKQALKQYEEGIIKLLQIKELILKKYRKQYQKNRSESEKIVNLIEAAQITQNQNNQFINNENQQQIKDNDQIEMQKSYLKQTLQKSVLYPVNEKKISYRAPKRSTLQSNVISTQALQKIDRMNFTENGFGNSNMRFDNNAFKTTSMSDYLPQFYRRSNASTRGFKTNQFSQSISCGKKILSMKPQYKKKTIDYSKFNKNKTYQPNKSAGYDFKINIKQAKEKNMGQKSKKDRTHRDKDTKNKQKRKKLKRLWKQKQLQNNQNVLVDESSSNSNCSQFYKENLEPGNNQGYQLQSCELDLQNQSDSSSMDSNFGRLSIQRQSQIDKAINNCLLNVNKNQLGCEDPHSKRLRLQKNRKKFRKSKATKKSILSYKKSNQQEQQDLNDILESSFAPLIKKASTRNFKSRKTRKLSDIITTIDQNTASEPKKVLFRKQQSKTSKNFNIDEQKVLSQFLVNQQKSLRPDLNDQQKQKEERENRQRIHKTYKQLKDVIKLKISQQKQNKIYAKKIQDKIQNFRTHIQQQIQNHINVQNSTSFCSLFWKTKKITLNQLQQIDNHYLLRRPKYLQTSFSKAHISGNKLIDQDTMGIDLANKLIRNHNKIIQKGFENMF